MSISSLIFLLATFISAVFVSSKNCVRTIMAFILLFLQAFFNLNWLGKDLFAFMLLIIYVGAIAVLFLFVVMTTEVDKKQVPRDLFLSVSNPNPSKWSNISFYSWKLYYVLKRYMISPVIDFLTSFNVNSVFILPIFVLMFYSFSSIFFSNSYLVLVGVFCHKYQIDTFLVSSLTELSYNPFWDPAVNILQFSSTYDRLFYWCNFFFVSFLPVLMLCAFLLFSATIGVIELVIPSRNFSIVLWSTCTHKDSSVAEDHWIRFTENKPVW